MLEHFNIKKEELKHASLLTWILISGLLVIVLIGIVIYRNLTLKRKNEKLESQKAQSELVNAEKLATSDPGEAMKHMKNAKKIFEFLIN